MLTIIALFTCLIWFWLTYMHGSFWRCSERLTDRPAPDKWPHVVVIIPARDEAETIGQVVAGHQNSDYPGELTLILADDGSTDGTADIAKANTTLDVVSVPDLAPSWTGKLWAVENALSRAEQIAPEANYVLLTDADILLAPDTLSRLVAKAEHKN